MSMLDALLETGAFDERSLREAWALLVRSGLTDARRTLAQTVDGLEAAQVFERDAEARRRRAKEIHETALLEARWLIEAELEVDEKGHAWIVDEDKAERRKLLASEKPAWLTRAAKKHPSVTAAAEGLQRAETEAAAASDAVRLAEKRIYASGLDLEAACTQLGILRIAIRHQGDQL